MNFGRFKAITSVAALIAMLAMGGAWVLHARPAEFRHVLKAPPAAAQWWPCDSPQCALPSGLAKTPLPRVVAKHVPAAVLLPPAGSQHPPHYTRPPPPAI